MPEARRQGSIFGSRQFFGVGSVGVRRAGERAVLQIAAQRALSPAVLGDIYYLQYLDCRDVMVGDLTQGSHPLIQIVTQLWDENLKLKGPSLKNVRKLGKGLRLLHILWAKSTDDGSFCLKGSWSTPKRAVMTALGSGRLASTLVDLPPRLDSSWLLHCWRLFFGINPIF